MNQTSSFDPEQRSGFANEGELREDELAVLGNPVGRDDEQGGEPGTLAAEDVHQPVGAIPKSTITGRHDAGSGANETIDGLDETEEMTRQTAEDVPAGSGDDVDDIPVFDRGDTLPRV